MVQHLIDFLTLWAILLVIMLLSGASIIGIIGSIAFFLAEREFGRALMGGVIVTAGVLAGAIVMFGGRFGW